MKVLNRPMFRMGGPIKEGIMSGIQEPKRGRVDGPGSYAGKENAGQVFKNVESTYEPKDFKSIVEAENIKQIFTPKFLEDKFRKEFSLDVPVTTDPGQFQFQYMTPDRYLPKEKSLERDEILKNPEAYDFYKKKYIEDEYSDKIKKQREILQKAEDKRESNIYGYEPPVDQSVTADAEGVKSQVAGSEIDDDPPPPTKKEKINIILEGLGYDRAQKNALYDAMIKAGQRISRTGLGAENLVSDVIAETSQSYDKPEKLREAANLMQVQQDLKIDQIKAQNEYKKNSYEEKEKYLTGILGDADLAKRISVGSPKNVIEAQQIVEKAGINSRSDKGVDATLSIYFDGISGVPKYKGSLSESNTEKLITLKGDRSVAEIKGEAVGDIDDGVYKLGKGYVDIRDGKIFDVREIISSFIEE